VVVVDASPPPAVAASAETAAADPTAPPTADPPTPKREAIPRKRTTGRDGAKGTKGGREAAAGADPRPEVPRANHPADSTTKTLGEAVAVLRELTHTLVGAIDVRAEPQAMSLKDLLSIGEVNKPALLLSTVKHFVSQKLTGSKPS